MPFQRDGRWSSPDDRIALVDPQPRRAADPARWWPAQPNGWWPRLSPTGEFVAYGNVDIWLVNLADGIEHKIDTAGRRANVVGWFDATRVMWVDNTEDHDQYLWLVDAGTGQQARLDVDPRLAAGNWLDCDAGHWGSSLATQPTPRITYDGRAIGAGLGMAIAGEWMCYAGNVAGGTVWGLIVYHRGEFHREIEPQAAANAFDINEEGIVSYGYFGPARINWPDGTDQDVTVTPWSGEGVPALVRDAAALWLISGAVTGTNEFVAIRKLSDLQERPGQAIVVPNAGAVAITAVKRGDVLIVAFCNDRGAAQVVWVPESTPYSALVPEIPTFPRRLWCGAFYQFSDRYGDDRTYPANVTVVVEAGAVERAVAKCPIVINNDPLVVARAVRYPDRVASLFIGDTGGWQNAQSMARNAKDAWRAAGGPPRPVLWYITPADAGETGFRIPDAVDWLGPQFYFDDPNGLDDQRWRLLGWWMDRIGVDPKKPWVPIYQAYDRNLNPVWQANMRNLVSVTPAFLDQLRHVDPRLGKIPPAIGLLFFAVQRPGGVKDYPALRQMHEALFRAIPGAPPIATNPVLQPPIITIVEPAFPVSGEAPLRVRCLYAPVGSSGPVDWIEWQYRGPYRSGESPSGTAWVVAARNPGSDRDHTYRFTEPGAYQIRAVAGNSAGTHETGAPRVVEVTARQKVSFRTASGHYLCAENEGREPLNATSVAAGPWEEFEVETVGQGTIALKAVNGRYVCAEDGGGRELIANRDALGPWETFRIHLTSEGVGLQADNGQFVGAENGGGNSVAANRDALGPWETFVPSGQSGW